MGVWTAGSIDWGRQNADGQRDQRFRTQGLTIGVDAHLTGRLIVGGGVGYGRGRSEIGENGTLSRARSLTGAVYGSWRITDAVFLDGVAGHGDLAFDSRRWAEGLGGEPAAFALGERGGLSPYARVEWSRELERLDEQGVRYADWASSPTYWVPPDAWSRDSLNLNLGAEWSLRDRLMFSAGYRGQLGDASQSHGGEFSLRWSW